MFILAGLLSYTKGIKFYSLQMPATCKGEHVFLAKRPKSVYNVNRLGVRLACGRFLLSHIEVPVAAHFSALMRDFPSEVLG